VHLLVTNNFEYFSVLCEGLGIVIWRGTDI
jgi:hypothetical protein